LYLIDHPGRIVTKEELLEAAWPGTFVQESVLKSCVLEIRKALGDNPKDPKCIATIHRRGYRFDDREIETAVLAAISESARSGIVGRETVLDGLCKLWKRASAGQRQLVFVTGEPGIGKSTLIQLFLAEAARTNAAPVLFGRCIQHYGTSEPYYPVFDALAGAVKDRSIPGLLDALRKYAPTWLIQMPGATPWEDREVLKGETVGATRERMLREMSEAIEVLSSSNPLILVLEDPHWSDISTLDLLSWIANRTRSARLLVMGSYRPLDVILSSHPIKSLKQNLAAAERCIEIELELLSARDIQAVLDQRFPGHCFPEHLAKLVHARTEGNPLFVHSVLDYAQSRMLITNRAGEWRFDAAAREFDSALPESLAKMIEAQIERLGAAQQATLEAASVAGTAFAVSLIAGEELTEASAEACCEDMARRNLFIRPAAPGSSAGGAGGAYEFGHALFRDVFYKRIAPARRARLHQCIGRRLEKACASRLDEVAAELACHFEESQDYQRAIVYLRLAAQRYAARHSVREALDALNRALELVDHVASPGKATAEIELIEQLGQAYRLMGLLTESATAFEKMHRLASQIGNVEWQLRARLWLAGVASFLDRARCLEEADQAIALCAHPIDSDLRASARGQAAYWNLLFRGWDEADAIASANALDAARRSYDRGSNALHASRHSYFQSLSSQYREACATAEEGVRIATEINNLLDYSMGHYFYAWALLHLGEWGRMGHLLHGAIEKAERNGHDFWILLFGLLESFRHIQAFSFDYPLQACSRHLETALALGHPLSVQMSHILLGLSCLGVGDLASARQHFQTIREGQAKERILMDWIWRMPLLFGISEMHLAAEDLESARREADEFISISSRTVECTWTALAYYTRARVAQAEGKVPAGLALISRGLETIGGCEAPLAEWRLHSLAAELSGDTLHFLQARTVIQKLAESLSSEDDLRRCFLSSPQVAQLMAETRSFTA
jgi:tetratricopeptide (TPR) repeat protein